MNTADVGRRPGRAFSRGRICPTGSFCAIPVGGLIGTLNASSQMKSLITLVPNLGKVESTYVFVLSVESAPSVGCNSSSTSPVSHFHVGKSPG